MPAAPTVMFPENLLLADVARQLDGIQRLWSDYLAKLTDETIDQTFEYQSLDAGRFRNRIEEILTQLYGHSLYHRGQIAILVKQAGGKPAATDFVTGAGSRSASAVSRPLNRRTPWCALMTADQFRDLALNLPEAVEVGHMGHPDFRVRNKIFATLGYPKADWAMVKLTPDQQEQFVEDEPDVSRP